MEAIPPDANQITAATPNVNSPPLALEASSSVVVRSTSNAPGGRKFEKYERKSFRRSALREVNIPNIVTISRIKGKSANRKSNASCDARPIASFLLSPANAFRASCQTVSPLNLQSDLLVVAAESEVVVIDR